MKFLRPFFALALSVSTAFAGGQKSVVVELPTLAAPLAVSAIPAPTGDFKPLKISDVSVPFSQNAFVAATLQTTAQNAQLNAFTPEGKPQAPEQQAQAASQTFDGMSVAAGHAPAAIEVSQTPTTPTPFALIPAAARLLQRHHLERPKVERLLSRAMRGMLHEAGVKTAKEARPFFKILRQAITPRVRSYGMTVFVYEGEPLFVNEVSRGSPAEKAGLRGGDEITRINKLDTRRIDEDLLKQIMASGAELTLTVQRHLEDGTSMPVELKVAPGDYLETEFHKRVAGISAAFTTVARAFAPTAAPALLDAALASMAGSLDRFTTYLNADDAEEFRNGLKEQHYGGLGLRMEARVGGMLIVGVAPGSPAARAGLVEGDMLLSVDGKSVAGLAADDAAQVVKREVGETVNILVSNSKGDRRELTLTLEDVGLPLAGAGLLPNGVGYLYLVSFSEESVQASHKLIAALRAQGARKLIIDLRFNPGGQLDAATQFSGYFLKKRSVVTTLAGTRGDSRAIAQRDGDFSDMPLAVILNRHSASASELFTAAVRDHERAFVVGEPSFGKGVGQETHGLTEGRALKITAFRWYTPAQVNLTEGHGIKPDIALTWTQEDMDPMFRGIAGPLFSGKTPGLEDAAVKAAWTGFQPVASVEK